MPTRCPIVSGNGGITENLSRVIDAYLQPFVLTLPSFIKDTILQKIDELSYTDESILVAIDIEALYSSIPNTKGLTAISRILKQGSRYDTALNEFINDGLEFILHHNSFLFDGSQYFQVQGVQGVAMGTRCAPSYVNLYLGGVGAVPSQQRGPCRLH